jgi:hypothetical protein
MVKIIAYLLMTVDHIGLVFFPDIMYLRIIGRLAFPLFLILLIFGYTKTKDFKKYLLRITYFSIYSQLPYMLAIPTGTLNIGFYLLECLIILWLIDSRIQFRKIIIIGILITQVIYPFQYGVAGLMLTVILYKFQVQNMITWKEIQIPKYLAYGYYPGHLLLIEFFRVSLSL